MKCLADGDRARAKEHFQAAVDTGVFEFRPLLVERFDPCPDETGSELAQLASGQRNPAVGPIARTIHAAPALRSWSWISPHPVIRQPLTDLAHQRGRQVRQQLREISLGIDVVPTAGAGQAGKDRRNLPTALVPDEQTVFTIEANSLHFPFASVVVDRDRTVRRQHVQFRPLVRSSRRQA